MLAGTVFCSSYGNFFILAAAKLLPVKGLKENQCSEQPGPIPPPPAREQGKLGTAPGSGIGPLPGDRGRLRPAWDISLLDLPRDPCLHLGK